MGSTKDIINLPDSVILPEGINRNSVKIFDTSNRFSIFDLKEYIKDTIPFKGESLCMQAANAFEILESKGIRTHYIGLLDENNKVIKTADLTKPSNRMVFKVADYLKDKVIHDKSTGKYDYSFFIENRGKLNNFVVLVECVFRNGAPEGSSLFRKTIPKWVREGDTDNIERFLRRTGLDEKGYSIEDVKPGIIFPNTIYDFWTKAEPSDRPIGDEENYKEAYYISGLTESQFRNMIGFMRKANAIMRNYLKSVSIDGYDGKGELIYRDGFEFGDFYCTMDEDRWLRNGEQVSKEFLRLYFENNFPDFYKHMNECKKEAQEKGLEDFRTLLKMDVPRFPKEVLDLTGEMYAAATDLVMQNDLFKENYETRHLDDVLKDVRKYR